MSGQKLPEGWLRANLLDVIIPRGERVSPIGYKGVQYLGMDHIEAHTAKIIGSVPAETMKSSASRFFKGDILYGRLRPYLNKVARPSFDGLASAEFIVFPENELIKSEFLKYRLNAIDFVNFSSHLNEGDRPRVSFQQIGEFQVLVPPPNEQHRIVAKIEELFSELDKGVESLKIALEQLKVYRQSLLKHAFEGKLTAQWRTENADKLETADQLLARIKRERETRFAEESAAWEKAVTAWEAEGKQGKKPTKPKKPKELPPLTQEELKQLPELPQGWGWVRVSATGKVQLGRQRSPKNRSRDFPTKYLRAANITEQGISLSDVLEMDFKPHERAIYELQYGDILLSEASGSPDQVGKPAIWKNEIPNCCFQNTLIRFQPYGIKTDYALIVFKYFYHTKIFAKTSSGVGINHLSAAKFSKLAMPVPSLQEQSQIVEEVDRRISILIGTEQQLHQSLMTAEALRQSILKKAFTGQLVLQDPNDEPASVLLERIRAGKVEKGEGKKNQTRGKQRGRKKREEIYSETGELPFAE